MHCVLLGITKRLLTIWFTTSFASEIFSLIKEIDDKQLNFMPHIKFLKAKCLKALYILKVLSHTARCRSNCTFTTISIFKLDYGSIAYGSARKSDLAMLDPIHHLGLKLALGAFRTSPTASLYVEADERSLNM